jgi:hypothetical protein
MGLLPLGSPSGAPTGRTRPTTNAVENPATLPVRERESGDKSAWQVAALAAQVFGQSAEQLRVDHTVLLEIGLASNNRPLRERSLLQSPRLACRAVVAALARTVRRSAKRVS